MSGAKVSWVRLRSHGRVVSVNKIFEIHPAIELSANNRFILCSLYIQVSATLFEQLRTTVDEVIRRFFDCPKLRKDKGKTSLDVTASITSQFRE